MSARAEKVLSRLTDLDFSAVGRKIERFVSDYVTDASASGVVIGLSGGLDSSVAAKLCADSLGAGRIFGLVLPSSTTPKQDVDDATALARLLGIKYEKIDIDPVMEKFMQFLPNDKKAKGNLMARVRMCIIYHHAFVKNSIVVGTSDKSELYIGYFTKYGDGGADIAPIADLYKTQVRELGWFLKIPASILEKKSSPRLWANHIAEEEIGVDYETVDPILHYLVDKKAKPRETASRLGVSMTKVNRIQSMIEKSLHKRGLAKILYLK
ncbi:NAD+ synthase [Nitrososphaera sp.]|uniref:NAD+ synthase n=1 Tax=Nitrososphaera sp. TaxID=1971748 RepID=UPI003174C20C